jgi:hypothetical protein
MNISIVGSSFSGLTVTLYLISRGFKPDLYDSDEHTMETGAKESGESNLAIKNPLDISKFYENRKYFRVPQGIQFIYENGINVRPTYAKGGFSNLWGASVQAYDHSFRKNWGIDKKLWYEAENFVKGFFPILENYQIDNGDNFNKNGIFIRDFNNPWQDDSMFLNYSIELRESTFAVSNVNLDGGNVIAGKSLLFEKFKTKTILDDIVKRKLVNYHSNHVLRKFSESSETVKLVFENDGKKVFKEADTLFLGTGVISTSKILLDSGLFKEIRIKDTQLFYMPAFSLRTNRITRRNNQRIVFPSFFMKIKKKGSTELFFQHYPMNELILQRFIMMVPKILGLFQPLFKFLLKRVGVTFGYLPTNRSGSLQVVSANNESTKISVIKQKIRGFSIVLKFITIVKFLKIGLLPFTFLTKYTGVGDSYHLGSNTFVDNLGEVRHITNEDGLIHNHSKVYSIDSSALHHLEPGPITYEMMLNAVRIAIKATTK